MVFVYKKLAQLAVRGALPPRRSESPGCAADNKPSCVLHLLGSFIGSRGFSFLERRPEFWVLQYKPCYSFLTLGFVIICVSKLCAFFAIRTPFFLFICFLIKSYLFMSNAMGWISELLRAFITERVTGRKARGLQMEEKGCKCQTL